MKTSQKKIAYWREQAEAFRASGLSYAEYSRRSGVNKDQLRYWLGRLDLKNLAPPKIPSGFSKVSVSDEDRNFTSIPEKSPEAIKPQRDMKEEGGLARLRLSSGHVFEFNTSVDPQWVGRLLSVLGG